MRGNRRLRAAIIGCGRIAGGFDEGADRSGVNTHAKSYQLHHGAELVAVADIDLRKAQRFSDCWGGPKAYGDIYAMLSHERPDIVSICTPDDTHADMLEMCSRMNSIKAIWCEKPIATDLVKIRNLVLECEKSGIVLAINYQRRWQPQMKLIGDSIRTGELGSIQKVVVFYSKGICHNGSHAIDLLTWWFGLPLSFCVLGSHVDYTPDDPTVDVRLEFNGVPVYLVGVDEGAHSLFEIQIIGTLGRINILSSGREIERYLVQPDPQYKGYQELRLQDVWKQEEGDTTITRVLEDIVAAIGGNGRVVSNGWTALSTLAIGKEIANAAIKARSTKGGEIAKYGSVVTFAPEILSGVLG